MRGDFLINCLHCQYESIQLFDGFGFRWLNKQALWDERLRSAIELRDVTFSYGLSGEPVLRNVDLSIPVGSRIALVGKTGSGKTTLAHLLLGLYKPESGELLLDGLPVSDEEMPAWQSNCAFVPQQIRLLDASVRENVAFCESPDEIDDDDGEDEVVIDHHGHRRALRVRPLADVPAAPTHAPAPDYASTRLTLEIAHPGQLSRLQWRTRPAQSTLARDQVRVKVLATGLNFRDVMYALGVLTDEALEQGFSGATLGLEFSGIVEALGDGVTRFEIGDPVVGLGSACFSNHLVVEADSLNWAEAAMSNMLA